MSAARPGEIDAVLAPAWARLPWLVHGFSTRAGGHTGVYGRQCELNLGFTPEDDPETVGRNRERWLRHVADGEPVAGLATVRQVHGGVIHRVGAPEAQTPGEPPVLEGDGLVTDEPGVLLGMSTADCVPVLLADPARNAVGAFHAGWRGTVAGIVAAGVRRMRQEFGSEPAGLWAAIGPAIGPCCYRVGAEVRGAFQAAWPGEASGCFNDVRADGSAMLDLPEANRLQLLAAGVQAAQVSVVRACTQCDPSGRFFSYRGERGRTGRMLAVVGVRRKG